jgi:hypothetical protein
MLASRLEWLHYAAECPLDECPSVFALSLWRLLGLMFFGMRRSSRRTRTIQTRRWRSSGGKLLPDGQASASLQARIRKGAEVAQKHEIKDFIFSGGDTARLGNTETAVMKSLWDAIGNDNVTIYTDDQS